MRPRPTWGASESPDWHRTRRDGSAGASPLGIGAHLRPQLLVGMLVEKARDDLIECRVPEVLASKSPEPSYGAAGGLRPTAQ